MSGDVSSCMSSLLRLSCATLLVRLRLRLLSESVLTVSESRITGLFLLFLFFPGLSLRGTFFVSLALVAFLFFFSKALSLAALLWLEALFEAALASVEALISAALSVSMVSGTRRCWRRVAFSLFAFSALFSAARFFALRSRPTLVTAVRPVPLLYFATFPALRAAAWGFAFPEPLTAARFVPLVGGCFVHGVSCVVLPLLLVLNVP